MDFMYKFMNVIFFIRHYIHHIKVIVKLTKINW